MKKILALSVFLFICVSMAFGIHPLIGKWKFSYVIDNKRFYDYLTITKVNTTTRRVAAHITGYEIWTLTGYYDGDIVFLLNTGNDGWPWLNGYYFTYRGEKPMKRYLAITYDPDPETSVSNKFYVKWRAMTAAKLSSSSIDTEAAPDPMNQVLLKKLALSNEKITARTLIE